MTGLRLELANPNAYGSPKEYVEKHLAPVVTELHRVVNELLTPGSTSDEEWRMDMGPAPSITGRYTRLVRPVAEWAKHVTFDGSEYFSIPKDLLRTKQVKVQMTAVVYSGGSTGGVSRFRLVDEQGHRIDHSEFETSSPVPVTVTLTLPFGEQRGCIHPSRITYYIEGCSPGPGVTPVCRRLSLSFVYI